MWKVRGEPIIHYPITEAILARKLDKVYVSTDSEEIANYAREYECDVIWRPEYLNGDDVNHGEVIQYSINHIDTPELKNVVILLGNTAMITWNMIDVCLEKLESTTEYSSVMTVWKCGGDEHPNRAMVLDKKGFLKTRANGKISTDRHSYDDVYFYNQLVWAVRKEWVQYHEGPGPWWWMGPKCYPIVMKGLAGLDVHDEIDLKIQEMWLEYLNRG